MKKYLAINQLTKEEMCYFEKFNDCIEYLKEQYLKNPDLKIDIYDLKNNRCLRKA